jgi:putative NADH-flavin reductase
MNILVFGASGATGHELVKQALLQGHDVTAFARNPQRLKIKHGNLTVIQGSLGDYKLIAHLVSGQDAVLSALGASSMFRFDQSVVDGVETIVRAMMVKGVERFIYLSFAGVKESRDQVGFIIRNVAPAFLSTEIEGHEVKEKIIRESQLKWTLVRPPTLTNGKHRKQFRRGEGISTNGFAVTISRKDVADFMLQQLTDTEFIRKAPLILY